MKMILALSDKNEEEPQNLSRLISSQNYKSSASLFSQTFQRSMALDSPDKKNFDSTPKLNFSTSNKLSQSFNFKTVPISLNFNDTAAITKSAISIPTGNVIHNNVHNSNVVAQQFYKSYFNGLEV
jgi:hypothetical protein